MLVRTTKRIAGFPPPGKVGQVDDEVARAAIARGDAEDMTSLSTRLRRAPEIVDDVGAPLTGDQIEALAGFDRKLEGISTPPGDGGWLNQDADPLGDVQDTLAAALEYEADHPNDDA